MRLYVRARIHAPSLDGCLPRTRTLGHKASGRTDDGMRPRSRLHTRNRSCRGPCGGQEAKRF
eukprot:8472748-Alexandrium_andersonii.AAC.1